MPPKFPFEVGSKPSFGTARRREPGPGAFRLLVLGSFGGEDRRGPVPIDVDTFDDVLARTAPRLRLAGGDTGAAAIAIPFSRLDDFHPDSLMRRVGLFAALPQTVLAAARSASPGPGPGAGSGAGAPGQEESDAATFGRLLGSTALQAEGRRGGAGEAGRAAFDLNRLIESVITPHIVPTPTARQELERRLVDEARSAALRAILHHPDFQALESAWRSVHRLVTHLETGDGVRIDLLDSSRDQAVADVTAAAAEGTPWSLIVADHTFGPSPEDCDLLEALASTAAQGRATLLAGADPALLGCRSFVEAPDPASWTPLPAGTTARWGRLRTAPFARSIGLALPRVLLRRPYGRRSDPVEDLPFEEMDPAPEHARYLWGNASFAVAEVIARAFQHPDAPAEPEDDLVLDDLPAAVEETGSGTRLKPCAETLLSEAAADAILSRGPMPLVSHRDRGSARLARLQSWADPPAPLHINRGGGAP